MRLIDLTGQTFGDWKVLRRGTASHSRPTTWHCLCQACGSESLVFSSHLRRGNSRSCGCQQGARLKVQRFKGCGELHLGFYTRMKYAATQSKFRRALEFTVSIEYLWSLFLSQERRCALSGLPLTMPRNLGTAAFKEATASVDRIDNARGYIEGNVQWVHKHINMMKRDFDSDYFIYLCDRVSEYVL